MLLARCNATTKYSAPAFAISDTAQGRATTGVARRWPPAAIVMHSSLPV